jgi:DUF1680 family protein
MSVLLGKRTWKLMGKMVLGISFMGTSTFGQTYPLEKIKLNTGVFEQAQQIDKEYILALDPDRLLAPYRIDAGLPKKAERYGNWESSGLDGHIGGHYLSALALMYAATGEKELKTRLDYMIAELAACQAENGDGYVGGIPQGKVFWERIKKGDIDGSSFGLNNTWVPLYNIHKLFAGLYDAHIYGKNPQASKVLLGLSDWMIGLFAGLSDEQMERILRTEHGGMNEAFLDVYTLTKDSKYLTAAQRFTQKAFLTPMIEKKDILTGLHANTQIPKMVGAEKISQVTKDDKWHQGAVYFWDNVAQHRTVAFGGNSYREHFHELDRFDKMLETNQGPETCNSYNMLKLSKELYTSTGDSKYLDFYEKTMFNHILSSQHPEKGGFVYFTPIRPNHYRVYSQPETSMWCCVGTGLENHTKYGEMVFTPRGNSVQVNFLVAATLNHEQGKLVLETAFPYENSARLRLENTPAVRIRIPSWMDNVKFTWNGKSIKPQIVQGFAEFSGLKGGTLSWTFSPRVGQEFLPNDTRWAAFTYGPLVLAAETGTAEMPGTFADDSRMGHETKGRLYPLTSGKVFQSENKAIEGKLKKGNGLTFDLEGVKLRPFFEVHETRYQMYFQILNKKEHQAFLKEVEEEKSFEESTLDKIDLGEQQPEADHAYKGEKSFSGYDQGHFWRSTSAWISYEMANKGGKRLLIQGLEKLDNLSISINEVVLTLKKDEKGNTYVEVPSTEKLHIKIQPGVQGGRTPRLTKLILQ